jgi:hypothetical protein
VSMKKRFTHDPVGTRLNVAAMAPWFRGFERNSTFSEGTAESPPLYVSPSSEAAGGSVGEQLKIQCQRVFDVRSHQWFLSWMKYESTDRSWTVGPHENEWRTLRL